MFFNYDLFAGTAGTILFILIILACFWRPILKWLLILSPVLLYILIAAIVDGCSAYRQKQRIKQETAEFFQTIADEREAYEDSIRQLPLYHFSKRLYLPYRLSLLTVGLKITDLPNGETEIEGSLQCWDDPTRGGDTRIRLVPNGQAYECKYFYLEYLNPATQEVVTVENDNADSAGTTTATQL